MNYPKITVVTCSYNQAKFLEEAILSVLNQGYPNLEYIVMDGNSSDNSVEIIRKYESQLACWVSEPDKGQSDALANGFARATGDVLCWLCSDDLLEPGSLLEAGRMFAEDSTLEVIYGDTLFIDAAGNITRKYKTLPFHRWLMLNTANYIPQPSTFWTRRIYEKVGGLDRSVQVCMDPELWLRFSEVASLRHVRRYWSRMRFYPEIKSLARKPEMLVMQDRFEKRYLGTRPAAVRLASRAVAKVIRVGYRASLGCYW